MTPLFLDANIPMYAAGSPHPMREGCLEILALVAERPEAFFTDAEVLQELLHRYLALNRWRDGSLIFSDFALLMQGRVEPVYADDVETAALMARELVGLSARDLLHAAVMQRVGTERIVSADRRFDQITWLQRLDPATVATWSAQMFQ